MDFEDFATKNDRCGWASGAGRGVSAATDYQYPARSERRSFCSWGVLAWIAAAPRPITQIYPETTQAS